MRHVPVNDHAPKSESESESEQNNTLGSNGHCLNVESAVDIDTNKKL